MFRHAGRLHHPCLLALSLLILLALQTTPLRAREETRSGLLAADEEMVQKLLSVRTRDELIAELESARKRKNAAEADLAEMEGISSVVSARVEVKKKEIELLGQRVRLAKKEADAPQVAQLENQRKQEERQLKVFEAMREAAGSQVDRAREAREFAQSRIDLQESELKLVEKREARVALASKPADAARQEDLATLDRQIREASRTVLSSIRDYARRSERLAKATEALARRNIELLDSWESYNAR
jgi:hypothetical protein